MVQTEKHQSHLNGKQRQAVRQAREKLEKVTGKRVRQDQILGEMAQAVADGLFDTPEGEADKKKRRSGTCVSIQPCPICLNAYTPTPEGLLQTPMAEWVKAIQEGAEVFDLTPEFFCDCEGAKHRRDQCDNWSRRKAPRVKGRYMPSNLKRIVRARDGFVCRVPGCKNDYPIQLGHLRPFKAGGPATPENISMQCGPCNQLIEDGKLKVMGHAPFERYYDAHGDFLGFGYDPEVRPEAAHVGNSDPRVRERAPKYAADPPGSGRTG